MKTNYNKIFICIYTDTETPTLWLQLNRKFVKTSKQACRVVDVKGNGKMIEKAKITGEMVNCLKVKHKQLK